jgi:hypothetical protein
MRNNAVRVLVAWFLIAAINCIVGVSFARRITRQLGQFFYGLTLLFRDLP